MFATSFRSKARECRRWKMRGDDTRKSLLNVFVFCCSALITVAMFGYRCTGRLQLVRFPLGNLNAQLRLFEKYEAFIIPKSYSSSTNKTPIAGVQEGKQLPFTVFYLVNSFGFSLQTAKSLSKNNGLTDTHISKLARSSPDVLLADTEKSFLPKLEFLRSVGVSGGDLADVVSFGGNILQRSLNKNIIPYNNLLKKFLKDDDKILRVLKRRTFFWGKTKLLAPNISLLQELGVPESSIMILLTRSPGVLRRSAENFKTDVEKLVRMGFDHQRTNFVYALAKISSKSRESWEHKLDVYMRFGWSEDEFLSVFRSYPTCMDYSKENITRKMDFFVNKLGLAPATVAKTPKSLGCSMDKRVIPRFSVIKTLFNEGLIMGKPAFSTLLTISGKSFRDRFVVPYQDQMPQLLDIFQGKVKISETVFKSEGKFFV
ncbi:transcription termination factor MTERF8, chloroplastic-like [Tripterygium wilfordii]|uniref:transcription termination factor MTERF8, chloroplastic-like n=1 Tax=Tripterygium wilfordii TaxID=458696 RepID=UPI0018F852CA|nr:transcription termination factor MTERF8, chloroplastic-like [Tripterygium wilfordii]